MSRDLHLDLAAAGGVQRIAELRRLGHSRRAIEAALASGAVQRPRSRWLSDASSDPAAVRAVQLGGRLGAASALISHGIWVDRAVGLIVACAPNAARLPVPAAGERRIWVAERFADRRPHPSRVSLLDALLQHAHDVPIASLVASIDSALAAGRLRPDDVVALAAQLPSRSRRLPELVDARSGSGVESHMRLLLREGGLRVRTQASIPGVGRVDLLVDEWLIVELDSRRHHDTTSDQERDRRRDGEATLRGYATVRFMAHQVLGDPGWCRAVVRARLRDGPPRANSGSRGSAHPATS